MSPGLPDLRNGAAVPVQRQIVERVARRRDQIAKLKADPEARADAERADVEAMIRGIKAV